jgi:hypothetical protein
MVGRSPSKESPIDQKEAAVGPYYPWLVLLRFAFVFSTGYIHPDEFFQSPEIAAGDVCGVSNFVPWEFGGDPVTGNQLPPSQV